MKTLTKLLATAALVISTMHMAQAQQAEGESVLNAGIGFVTFTTGDAVLPPIGISYDYGLTDEISLGGYLGYSSSEEEFAGFFGTGAYTWTYTYIIVGVRGAYHFEVLDNIDTYGGLMLGYNVASTSFDGDPDLEALVSEPSVGGFAYSAFVGGRYYFTESFGAFAELGYGIAALTVGVNFKF